jgi:prophage maintenance system killer protein
MAEARASGDGNRRTAFATAPTRLRLDAYASRPDAPDGARMTEGLARGEATSVAWLRAGMENVRG